MKSCVISDELYEAMPSNQPKFNLLDNLVVYHNIPNEKRLTSNSPKNEFGDKNNLDISLSWPQIRA